MILFIAVGLEFFNLDYLFSSLFFDFQTNKWPLRDFWLTKEIFHDWGQNLSKGMGGIVFLVLLMSFFIEKLKKHSKLLLFLLVASISGPIFIAILKSSTHIYCPWSLKLFGGNRPYIHLFDRVDSSLPIGHCFPGGHSGGGFAFVSLYYFFVLINPKYKFYGLGAGLIIGLVFGLTQEMRGAHFLSHDIFSLFICWATASTLFLIFFYKQLIWQTKKQYVEINERA
ncbi:MAG: phosphatase PAP2 family protein [Methylococcaceae bacterium]|nr:phosphatase PAP2 family protein [Methylococcaceae bacterium]